MKLGILLWFMAGNAFCQAFTMGSGSANSRNNSQNQRTSYKYFPSKEEDTPSFSDNAGAVFDENNSNETFQPQPEEKKKTGGGGGQLSSLDLKWNQALQDRIASLQQGIGKRYICKTQKGFLNVHSEPADPYETANIVNQLVEGQVVTSTAPARGPWILHDGGGWSISVFGGHTWLEPLPEDQ